MQITGPNENYLMTFSYNEKYFIKDKNGNIIRKSENLNQLINKTSWNKLRLIK